MVEGAGCETEGMCKDAKQLQEMWGVMATQKVELLQRIEDPTEIDQRVTQHVWTILSGTIQILKEDLDVCRIFVLKNERLRVEGAAEWVLHMVRSESYGWKGREYYRGRGLFFGERW